MRPTLNAKLIILSTGNWLLYNLEMLYDDLAMGFVPQKMVSLISGGAACRPLGISGLASEH